MAVGKDTHVSENQPDPDGETAAARRLAEALDPSAIDALLADAKAAGTPIDGVDGLLNQMTKAVLERSLQTEMTHHLGYDRDDTQGPWLLNRLVRRIHRHSGYLPWAAVRGLDVEAQVMTVDGPLQPLEHP